jgi:transposase-like protein
MCVAPLFPKPKICYKLGYNGRIQDQPIQFHTELPERANVQSFARSKEVVERDACLFILRVDSSTKSKSKTFSYRCNDCRKDFSILTHSIMENTHIPLQKWFLALLLMSRDRRGASALELARDLDISNEKQGTWRSTSSLPCRRENRPICSLET